jgi:hypothetical protein
MMEREAEKRRKSRVELVARIGSRRNLLELDVGPQVCICIYTVFIHVYIGICARVYRYL